MSDSPQLVFILHNIRSAHNVGSLFRSADGIGVGKIYGVGYTPLPAVSGRKYLTPAEKELKKTALGAETWIPWESRKSILALIRKLKGEGFQIVALEITPGSICYTDYEPKEKVALLLGNEIDGISRNVLEQCDVIIDIPMFGKKESLNVAVAGAVAGFAIQGRMRTEGKYTKRYAKK